MTERWDRLAPLYNGKRVVKRPISQPITLPKGNDAPIDPQIGFSVELYAGTFGMALIPATYDQSFVDSARLFLKGSGQQISPQKPTVEFADPFSGKVFVAVSQKNGVIETGIGARMIQRAGELEALIVAGDASTEVPLRSYLQMMDVMRTLTAAYADEVQ